MSLRLILCTAAVIGFAAPASTVLAAPSAPQADAQATPEVEELDVEEASARFKQRMDALKAELETVVAANIGDSDALSRNVDATIARYKSDIDAFANVMDTYFVSQIEGADTDTEKQEYQGVREQVVPMLRSLDQQIRTAVLEGANAPK